MQVKAHITRAPGAANVLIIGLGAGDTEVSLGKSSLLALPSIPESNYQTTLPGDLPVWFSWHLLNACWARHQGLDQLPWISHVDTSGWAQQTTSLKWLGCQPISHLRELSPSGGIPAGVTQPGHDGAGI